MKSFQILIFLLSISIYSAEVILCGKGKDKPKNEKQCTKYGTDSGFLCCHVTTIEQKTYCSLVSYKFAENYQIKGKKTLDDGTIYSCGNSSTFIKISSVLVVILLSILL